MRFGCVLILALASLSVSAQELRLVANVPGGGDFDGEYALSLVRGENKNWDGGADAIVVLPSRQSALHESVAKQIFSSSGRSMQRRWFQLVFSGRVNAPKYLDSDKDVIKYVLENEGAVGIVAADAATVSGLKTSVLSP